MQKHLRNVVSAIFITIAPTLIVWFPFIFRLKHVWGIPLSQNGMATIVANYDGPLFLAVAKTLYNPVLIKEMFSFPLPTQYYAAHFPLFPLIIKPFAYVLGFPYAMLTVTLLSSVAATYFFMLFIRRYVKEKNILWITLLFTILPARWLIVKSVGSAEPLFIASIIASVYYFREKRYLLAGVWGAAAQLTKSPGILLFIAYFLTIISPEIKKLGNKDFWSWLRSLEVKKYLPLLLIPLSLLLLFTFYKIRFNDFLAYFHSGDNIHIFFPPFQIFNYSAPWVGTYWLEEVIFVYLFCALGILKLIKQKEDALAWFVGAFFVSTLFVAHRDIIRYSLPMIPFLFAAFSKTIIKKEFKVVMCVLAIPIFLFSIAFISQNSMPISDWAPFL